LNGGKVKINEEAESQKFEISEDDLDFLKFGMERIMFKERRGSVVDISCDPSHIIKDVARLLNGLYPPVRKSEGKSGVSVEASNDSSGLINPTIIDIANIAYSIWQHQFSQKMKEAFFELFMETFALTAIELSKKYPDQFNKVDPTMLLNIVSKGHYQSRRRRLNAQKHGGNRWKRNSFNEVVQPIVFAYYVDCLRLLWKYISDFVEKSDHDPESINKLKRTKVYELLSEIFPVPKRLLTDILKKHEQRKKPEYQPLGFAVRHASLLLEIKKNTGEDYTFNTLLALYRKGQNKAYEYKDFLKKHSDNPIVAEMISPKRRKPNIKLAKSS
jgi:hypothetical protein